MSATFLSLGISLATVLIVYYLVAKQVKNRAASELMLIKLVSKVEAIQHDISAICAASTGVDKRISVSDRRIKDIVERLDEVENSEAFEKNHGFQGAVELAKKGADVSEIMDASHLTLDEAELLLRLHKV